MTRYRLPMRWADLDQLNHVNNVVYLAYAAEARAALVDDGVVDAALEPVSIGIDFLRPMMLSRRSVDVEQELDADVLTQEITQAVDPAAEPEREGQHDVFARLETRLGARADLGAPQVDGTPFPFRGRRGDVDPSGSVDPVRVFEYFQEARIIWMSRAGRSREIGHVVVAHVEVEYGRPVPWRREAWEMVVAVSRFGTKSFTLVCEWRDGETVLARNTAVLVAFDVSTQAARPLTAAERAYLEGL
ncbi:acyl-CoA thioesterase [Aeromicrobium alkaliterrae]|uniref:Acyl-ACP thioesterase-like C-terminal domain-containing protein n=1 Tax=Aeromicrobium alkaliterrae TaxID=302168 RepID=A0ABP4VU75_9ACTN